MRADVCLQGGAEFRPGCEEMDSRMIPGGETDRDLILVAPFAARPGGERRAAGENARRWYLALGARRVEVAWEEGAEFSELLATAGLLVMPGGSPERLLGALSPSADALRLALEQGTAISGASAGAMVLCRWTVLPGSPTRVTRALSLVPVDLVLPHFRGGTQWIEPARRILPEDAVVLGIPERSGVLVRPDGSLESAGVERFSAVPVA